MGFDVKRDNFYVEKFWKTYSDKRFILDLFNNFTRILNFGFLLNLIKLKVSKKNVDFDEFIYILINCSTNVYKIYQM